MGSIIYWIADNQSGEATTLPLCSLPWLRLPLNRPSTIHIATTLLYCSALRQCCYCDGSRFTWEWRSVSFLVCALPLWYLRDPIVDAVSREGGQRRVAIKGRGKRAGGIYIYVVPLLIECLRAVVDSVESFCVFVNHRRAFFVTF